MITAKTENMKRIQYKITFLCLACWALIACNKGEKLMYTDDPGIFFFEGYTTVNPDSIDRSFVVKPDDITADTVILQLRISGFAADKDRQVNLLVADSSTGEKGKHFRFDPVIVKAGEYKVDVPVYLLRTPDMKQNQFRIWLTLGESADFKPAFKSRISYLIKVSDQLTKPEDWEDWLYGNYSLVKHQFMVSRLGHAKITMSMGAQFSEMLSILQKMRTELADYELENGLLMDENGDQVTFPMF